MFMINRILVLLGAMVIFSSSSSAFFLNWGTQETPTTPPHYYYHQRLLQSPTSYTMAASEPQPMPVAIPSIPVQMPLQAQIAPAATVQNVQLVPCLCPVSQEFEYDKTHNPEFFTSNNINQQHKNQ